MNNKYSTSSMVVFYFILFLANFLNFRLKKISCANFTNGVFRIFFLKSFHILRRNGPNLQETSRNKEFVGKFLLIEWWGNEYCEHVQRAWREAKSCSPGDRPPTHYFNTGHRPGFWFLDPHFSTHKPPALALALALILCFHKWTNICWWTQDKTFTWHMKKCWKWGVEIHDFHFIGLENHYRV
jgi:hypothetical protein